MKLPSARPQKSESINLYKQTYQRDIERRWYFSGIQHPQHMQNNCINIINLENAQFCSKENFQENFIYFIFHMLLFSRIYLKEVRLEKKIGTQSLRESESLCQGLSLPLFNLIMNEFSLIIFFPGHVIIVDKTVVGINAWIKPQIICGDGKSWGYQIFLLGWLKNNFSFSGGNC